MMILFKVDNRHKVNRKQSGLGFKFGVRFLVDNHIKIWHFMKAAEAVLGESRSVEAWFQLDRNIIASSRWTYIRWGEPNVKKQAVFFQNKEDLEMVRTYYALALQS